MNFGRCNDHVIRRCFSSNLGKRRSTAGNKALPDIELVFVLTSAEKFAKEVSTARRPVCCFKGYATFRSGRFDLGTFRSEPFRSGDISVRL